MTTTETSFKTELVNKGWAVAGVTPTLDALIDGIQAGVPLANLSRLYVAYILERNNGNKYRSAIALGIDRRTIQRWAKNQLKLKEKKLVDA